MFEVCADFEANDLDLVVGSCQGTGASVLFMVKIVGFNIVVVVVVSLSVKAYHPSPYSGRCGHAPGEYDTPLVAGVTTFSIEQLPQLVG
jgi:hypothetical protein